MPSVLKKMGRSLREVWPLNMCRRREPSPVDVELGLGMRSFVRPSGGIRSVSSAIVLSPSVAANATPFRIVKEEPTPDEEHNRRSITPIVSPVKNFLSINNLKDEEKEIVETFTKSSARKLVRKDTPAALFLSPSSEDGSSHEDGTETREDEGNNTKPEDGIIENLVIEKSTASDLFPIGSANKVEEEMIVEERVCESVKESARSEEKKIGESPRAPSEGATTVNIILDAIVRSNAVPPPPPEEESEQISIYATSPQPPPPKEDEEERTQSPVVVEVSAHEADSGFTSVGSLEPSVQRIAVPPPTMVVHNGTMESPPVADKVSSGPPLPISYQRQKSTSSDNERRIRQRRLQMPLMYRMYESISEDVRGTINGPEDEEFRPEEASKSLRLALSGGIQSDDKTIISVLLSHTNFQRQKITTAYEGMYNRKLADDIEEEAGGYFLDATLALLQPAHVYSARVLHHALSGRSSNRSIAVELGLTSSASQLKVIRDAYFNEYNTSLEKDLSVKVEGLFGKMLQMILLRNRDPELETDAELAESHVALITKNEHGVEELGRNVDLFQKVLCNQSLPQVRLFLDRYDAQMANSRLSTETISDSSKSRDFESVLRKSVNIHSEVRQMLLIYARIARNMQLYFAERLHEAISGTRADHAAIIRVLVARSEIDLHDICEEYKRKFGRHIVLDLQYTCSGDFLRLLNLLVNPSESAEVPS